MTDSFEKWINSFTDEEYDEMLDDDNPNGFTDAQQEKALNIRQPPTKQELEDLELEQEFDEEPTPSREPRRFTDVTVGERVTEETGISMVEPTQQIPPSQPTVTPPITQPRVTPPKPPKITQQVKQAFVSAGKFVRRFFRV